MSSSTLRLNKILARSGIASRRGADELIASGQVTVNGDVAQLGQSCTQTDVILVKGKLVTQAEIENQKFAYYLVYKPRGVVSTVRDELGRPNVRSLVSASERIFPVGRLDENSEGLMLLTNDGEVTYAITHPKFAVPKTYHTEVAGSVTETMLKRLREGVKLTDGMTSPAKVEQLTQGNRRSWLAITITEGRKHQVRRMMSKVGLEVLALRRITLGPLSLGSLKVGESRPATSDEVIRLRSLIETD